jgi:hypothetical protein
MPRLGGELYCEGDDTFGQLAGGRSMPTERPFFEALSLGNWHGCLLSLANDETMNCWGRNDYGQLGYVTAETCPAGGSSVPCSRAPREVPLKARNAGRLVSVAVGDMFTCAVWERRRRGLGASAL